jgi:hypothetical protein
MLYYVYMSKFDLKPEAFYLRKKGISYGEIAKRLCLSKSTISLWCSDILLTEKQEKNLKNKIIRSGMNGRLLGAQKNKNKKLLEIREAEIWAKEKIGKISTKELLIANVALYWAEGSKKSNTGFIFVNSDPDMILFIYNWLMVDMNISKEDFSPRVSINISHKDRVMNILKYWSNLLDLPVSSFGNPYFINTTQKKRYQNHDSYYGVLRLRLKKSTNFRYKILALIGQLKSNLIC